MRSFITALLVILLVSCSKNDEEPQEEPNVNPVTAKDTLNGWTKHQALTGQAFISDIAFVSPAKGFIIWQGGIRRSLDSGKTWTTVPINTLATNLVALNFYDDQFGYTVGDGAFGYTRDGGDSWTFSSIPAMGYDVFFNSPTTGFFVGPQGLYKTTDTGLTWTQVKSGGWYAIYFKNASEGWASQTSGPLHKTTDGGITWTALSGTFPGNIMAFDFSGQFGLASAAGTFLRTTDNGQTWQTLPGFSGPYFIDVQVVSPTLIYATAGNAIHRSTDGGATWSKQMSLANEGLVELEFLGSQYGWAASDRGNIVRFAQ